MEMEKHTDPLDIAARNERVATEDAIREQRKHAVPQQIPDAAGNFKVVECVECGEDIGDQRLRVAIKNTLCLDCASAQERKTNATRR